MPCYIVRLQKRQWAFEGASRWRKATPRSRKCLPDPITKRDAHLSTSLFQIHIRIFGHRICELFPTPSHKDKVPPSEKKRCGTLREYFWNSGRFIQSWPCKSRFCVTLGYTPVWFLLIHRCSDVDVYDPHLALENACWHRALFKSGFPIALVRN
jgi:hypothetical protein